MNYIFNFSLIFGSGFFEFSDSSGTNNNRKKCDPAFQKDQKRLILLEIETNFSPKLQQQFLSSLQKTGASFLKKAFCVRTLTARRSPKC